MENTNLVLAVDPKEFGIEETKALELTVGLNPILEARAVLIEKFNEIKDLEPTKENVNLFKELGKEFLKNRTQGINEWHRKAKEVSLRVGQLLDAVKRDQTNTNENYENFLESKAKHFENLEKERIAKLRAERWEKISKYVEFEPQGLAEMSPDTFEAFESGLIARHEAKVKAEKEAEEIAKAELEAEKERIRLQEIENAKLKAEAEKREKKMEIERKRNEELRPYIVYIRDYNKMISLDEKEYQKELESIKMEVQAEREYKQKLEREAWEKREAFKHSAVLFLKENGYKLNADDYTFEDHSIGETSYSFFDSEAELEEFKDRVKKQISLINDSKKAKALEAELQAKKDAEEKAEQAKKDAEIQAKKEADKLAKAPIKQKLKVALDALKLELPESDITADILSKFDGFKRWATSEIEKL